MSSDKASSICQEAYTTYDKLFDEQLVPYQYASCRESCRDNYGEPPI